MNLDDYLSGLKNSADKELNLEFGVSPVWVMFVDSDLSEIRKNLSNSKNLVLTEENSNDLYFDYVPGSVDIKVTEGLCAYGLAHFDTRQNDLQSEHYRQYLKNYNMSIIFYPYQKKVICKGSQMRATANAILDLCNLSKEGNIPICLPNSIGSRYFKPKTDLSRMVFYLPGTIH